MFRALASGFASIAEGMASILGAFSSPAPYKPFSSTFTSNRTVTRSTKFTFPDGTEKVVRYEDMTPEEQRDFDRTFEEMDQSFKTFDKAFDEFDKAFDTPFFRGRRR